MLEALSKCYSLLEMFPKSPFYSLPQFPNLLNSYLPLLINRQPPPTLSHVSEERIISRKSFKLFETKEWDKYPILIMMIISGTRKM